MKYPDLNSLLRSEPEAKRYYDALPDYVREQIDTRPAGVNSLAGIIFAAGIALCAMLAVWFFSCN